MHIIAAIIIGFIVGLIARAIVPGPDPHGFIVTSLLGIIGAVVAKFIGQGIGWYGPYDNAGFVSSIIGAIVLLVICHAIFRGRAQPSASGAR
jgi:uncharacterized membrane protein YeaQ/YmgE (transglycosylase-associated protein family)